MTSKPTISIPYVAGLLDGEGYLAMFRSNKGGKRYFRTSIKIAMVDDFGLLQMLKDRWGGNLYNRKPRSNNHRPTTEWVLYGRSVTGFLEDVIPYLIVKKQQAEIILDYRKFISYNNTITDNVQEYREHLFQGLKGLHHSIPFTVDGKLRDRAIKDMKTKKFVTKETRENMSKAQKIVKNHPGRFKKGDVSWNKGRKLSEEHKRKIGEANRKKKLL